MRVAFDHQIFFAQRYGGISRYFYELITRSVRAFDVSLFQGFHINDYGLENHRASYRGYFGRKRTNTKRAAKLLAPVNRGLFELFMRRYPADVYHATYYSTFARHVRTWRVLTVYDMIHERFADLIGDPRLIASKRAAVAQADHVIAISHSTKRDLIDILGVRDDKVTVVHLANSMTEAVTDASPVDGPYVLYVAGRQSYKGFATLVEAMGASAACRGHKLVCFGAKDFTAAERDLFTANGLAERALHFAGSDALLARLYAGARVLVYPSLYEGFGLPPLEAMFYRCPVIASRSSSITEVVDEAGLLFEPGNVEELRVALDRVLTDTALRDDLIQRGTAREKQFSWDRMFEQTAEVYRNRPT